MQKIVARGHFASYPDPIAFKAGDELVVSDRSDSWDGYTWLWAQGPDGKSGSIPNDSVEIEDGRVLASRTYSAIELTCSIGEVLTVLEITHGRAWCRSPSGEQGCWVPLRNLSPDKP